MLFGTAVACRRKKMSTSGNLFSCTCIKNKEKPDIIGNCQSTCAFVFFRIQPCYNFCSCPLPSSPSPSETGAATCRGLCMDRNNACKSWIQCHNPTNSSPLNACVDTHTLTHTHWFIHPFSRHFVKGTFWIPDCILRYGWATMWD